MDSTLITASRGTEFRLFTGASSTIDISKAIGSSIVISIIGASAQIIDCIDIPISKEIIRGQGTIIDIDRAIGKRIVDGIIENDGRGYIQIPNVTIRNTIAAVRIGDTVIENIIINPIDWKGGNSNPISHAPGQEDETARLRAGRSIG